MDELKAKSSEIGGKIDAFQSAAKSSAQQATSAATSVVINSKDKVAAVYDGTSDRFLAVKQLASDIWNYELIVEVRGRVSRWFREAGERLSSGNMPPSPFVIYNDLMLLLRDRFWRHNIMIFACGMLLGGGVGIIVGLRLSGKASRGPHCKALHSHSDGTVLYVEDSEVQAVNCNEVLVRIQAFSVCPVDRAVLRGRGSYLRSLINKSPVSVGRGFAGIVLDVGANVSELEMGDEVWGSVSEWMGGSASELLTIKRDRLSKRPRGLAADVAASLPWAGAQCLRALDWLMLDSETCKGKRVVIPGAGSGEGVVLVQVLSTWGTHVTSSATHKSSRTLKELGSSELVSLANSLVSHTSWDMLEKEAITKGPWDLAIICPGPVCPSGMPPPSILRSCSPRWAMLDLRPRALITDNMFAPFGLAFAGVFSVWRTLRWFVWLGRDTDFMETRYNKASSMKRLTEMVESGIIKPVLDKVYEPQEYEVALAHACSEDALGTTVIRFPPLK